MKKRPGDSCKVGRPQLRTAGVAGWVVIKAPFARQLLSLRTCASLAASEIIHGGAERASSGKAGTANHSSNNPGKFRERNPHLRRENRDSCRSSVAQPGIDLGPRPTVQVEPDDKPKFLGRSQRVNIQWLFRRIRRIWQTGVPNLSVKVIKRFLHSPPGSPEPDP